MTHSGMRRTHPLGVFRDKNSIALVGLTKYGSTWQLVHAPATGDHFKPNTEPVTLIQPLGRTLKLDTTSNFRISQVLHDRLLSFTEDTGTHSAQLRLAKHTVEDDLAIWQVLAADPRLQGPGQIVPEYRHLGQYVLYYGADTIKVAFSKNLVSWQTDTQPLAHSRVHEFDNHNLSVVGTSHLPAGIMVVYASTSQRQGKTTIQLGAILCSATEPDQVIWRSDAPLHTFEHPTTLEPRILGVAIYDVHINFYFTTSRDKIVVSKIPNPFASHTIKGRDLTLGRSNQNPILSPTSLEWESQAVFNPAAFVADGRVHLLYRAMGPDGISRIGYASSSDGIHFDERLSYPVYTPSLGYGLPDPTADTKSWRYDPDLYPSGGGWAGCEDPRAVCIENKVYMTFHAFNGWDFMRQAITSISLDHLAEHKWHWKPPALISKPGQPHKNWLIFPEKINGKYAILHGLSPQIFIDYVDSLDQLDGKKYIDSVPPAGGNGYHDPRRTKHWDSRVRGAGAPPIKTPMGWLLLYHANDHRDPGKYKLGAMLLDLEDPTNILYRSNAPILAPQEWYENDGKPGVVYTCGAVILGDNLVVYYGGGDKHVGVARANVKTFIDALVYNHNLSLESVTTAVMDVSS